MAAQQQGVIMNEIMMMGGKRGLPNSYVVIGGFTSGETPQCIITTIDGEFLNTIELQETSGRVNAVGCKDGMIFVIINSNKLEVYNKNLTLINQQTIPNVAAGPSQGFSVVSSSYPGYIIMASKGYLVSINTSNLNVQAFGLDLVNDITSLTIDHEQSFIYFSIARTIYKRSFNFVSVWTATSVLAGSVSISNTLKSLTNSNEIIVANSTSNAGFVTYINDSNGSFIRRLDLTKTAQAQYRTAFLLPFNSTLFFRAPRQRSPIYYEQYSGAQSNFESSSYDAACDDTSVSWVGESMTAYSATYDGGVQDVVYSKLKSSGDMVDRVPVQTPVTLSPICIAAQE